MTLRDRYRRWRLYTQTVEELRQCTDRDLADMGLSRADIRSVARRSASEKF